jgi:mannosyltransferase
MKVIIDGIIFRLQKQGGISIYFDKLIAKLLFYNVDVDLLGIEKMRSHYFLNPYLVRSIKEYFLFVKRYLPVIIIYNCKCKNRLFHSSYYRVVFYPVKLIFGIKEVCTVHDFTYELYSHGLRKYIHKTQKILALYRADCIICVSHNTLSDLLKIYPWTETKKIRVIHNGISDNYFPILNMDISMSISIDYKYGDFILYVGSRADYKNFDFVIECLKKHEHFNLVIVGAELNGAEQIYLNNALGERWFSEVLISEERLNLLYNKAFALFYPSSYEGFGIPLVEAMRAKCPIIALNIPVFKEFIPDSVYLMEDLIYEEFIKSLNLIKENGDSVISESYTRSLDFTWDNTTEQIIQTYKEIFE